MSANIIVAAFVTGGLLGLSGAILQSVLRNPLAEPYMLGLTGGASLFVAAVMHLGWMALSPFIVPAAAFLGSCFSLALVCLISFWAKREKPVFCGLGPGEMMSPEATLILAGFVTGSITCSFQMVILSQSPAHVFAELSTWLFGNVRTAHTSTILAGAGVLSFLMALMLLEAKKLNLMELGADTAQCLGLNVRRTILIGLAASSLATASAVAIAGAIGFIGLVVPHIIRRLFGYDHRLYLPLSVIGGGVFLILAECLGQYIPGSLSAGIICAIVGGPFFLFLLTRNSF